MVASSWVEPDAVAVPRNARRECDGARTRQPSARSRLRWLRLGSGHRAHPAGAIPPPAGGPPHDGPVVASRARRGARSERGSVRPVAERGTGAAAEAPAQPGGAACSRLGGARRHVPGDVGDTRRAVERARWDPETEERIAGFVRSLGGRGQPGPASASAGASGGNGRRSAGGTGCGNAWTPAPGADVAATAPRWAARRRRPAMPLSERERTNAVRPLNRRPRAPPPARPPPRRRATGPHPPGTPCRPGCGRRSRAAA